MASDVLACSGLFRKHVLHRLEAQKESLKALEKRIVQIPGDSISLGKSGFKLELHLFRHLMDAQPVSAGSTSSTTRSRMQPGTRMSAKKQGR